MIVRRFSDGVAKHRAHLDYEASLFTRRSRTVFLSARLPPPCASSGPAGIIVAVAVTDLLTEAKYAERLRHVPERGPDLMTFVRPRGRRVARP